MNRKIDCLNIPLEDRVAAKVLGALKNEFNKGNITAIMNTENTQNNIAIPEINFLDVANGVADQQENLENPIELNQESLEDRIHREQWVKMSIADVNTKMKELGIPDLLYASGPRKDTIHKNKKSTVAHCLKWARPDKAKEVKEVKEAGDAEEIKKNSKISSEDLKEMIHDIHNFLRNSGIGYGISALKIFNLLYGLKKIEKFDLFDKIELDRSCAFSSLVKLAKDRKDICRMFNTEYLEHLHDSIIQNFLMEELPDHIKEKDLRHLVLEIDTLVELEYSTGEQLSGKIYEYFIGRDESAISELGAYFTNRLIVDYIYDLVDPRLGPDGEVQTMVDPFGGSGGFTGGYIQHLQTQNPNWKTGLGNVFHIDMNNDVVKYAGMEFMCLTQEVPEMGKSLRCENSFTFEFDPEKLFKFIFTNPPYGGDKNSKYGKRLANDKLLKHLKELVKPINDLLDNNKKEAKNPKKFKRVEIPKEQLLLKEKYDKQIKGCLAVERKYTKKFDTSKVSLDNSSNFIRRYAHKHKLTSNDKEGVSLILMMALLAPGGTAVGVLKEGVFFNSTYRELRKHLLTHFKVLKVISVPQDQFENTSTKTSIVIFERPEGQAPSEPLQPEDAAKQSSPKPEVKLQEGGNPPQPRTTQVEFRKLNVLKHSEDKFEWDDKTSTMSLIESADEVYGLDDPIVANATFEEIKAKEWCLDGKKYNVKQLIPGEGFKMVKLGDKKHFQVDNGYAFKKNEYRNDGIPIVRIKNITKDGLDMSGCVFVEKCDKYEKFSIDANDLIITLTGKAPTICKSVLWDIRGAYYLNQRLAKIKSIKYDIKYIYYVFKAVVNSYLNTSTTSGSIQDNITTSQLQSLQIPVPVDPEVTAAWVGRISAPYDLARKMETQLKQLETEVSDEIRRITEEEPCDEFKLGDLCEFNPSRKLECDEIDYVDISSLSNGSITKTTHYKIKDAPSRAKRLVKKYDIIYSTVRPKQRNYTIIEKSGLVVSTGFAVIVPKDRSMLRYIFGCITSDDAVHKLSTMAYGSNYPTINVDILSKIQIKIPKDKALIEELKVKFQQIEQCKGTLRDAEEQFKTQVDELGKAALKK